MKKIDYKELRLIQLEILQKVHDFCVENKINYSLAYGTLLGAVRHGGYIPWDDDIDIAMLRQDYERFRIEFKDDNLRFCDCRTDNDINIGFGKVEDIRTLVIEDGNTKNLGVNIDVFPIDNLCDTYDDSVNYFSSFHFYKFVAIVKYRPVKYVKKWWKKMIVSFLKIVFYPLSGHTVMKLLTKKAISNNNNKSIYVGLVSGTSFGVSNVELRKVWENFEEIIFEGRPFLSIKDTDSYLKQQYGDYMQLPPVAQQVPKHDVESIYWKE